MGAMLLLDEKVTFSPQMPFAVNKLLQAGVAATSCNIKEAEKLFLEAQQLDNHCLQTYFALYKFYFFQKRLPEAEHFAIQGLEESARQGGFPSDYRRLVRDTDYEKWDLYANEIGLFYLYTLKALIFIKMRQGHILEAQVMLEQLKKLDPKDLSGASVIRDVANSFSDFSKDHLKC